MTVDRTQVGCQIRYTLHDGAGTACTLTFGADGSAPPEWNILLPGTGGRSHPDDMHRFAAPVAVRLGAWLASIIGADRAAELAAAVGAQPPRSLGWQRPEPAVAGLSIPRQRGYRA